MTQVAAFFDNLLGAIQNLGISLEALIVGLVLIAIGRTLWHRSRSAGKFLFRRAKHPFLRHWARISTEPIDHSSDAVVGALQIMERRQMIFGLVSDAFWFSAGLAITNTGSFFG